MAAFGSELHVTGTDEAALEQTLREEAAASPFTFERVDTNLEDVFIHLIAQATDNWGTPT